MKILEEWLISDRNPFIFYSNVFFFLWNKLCQTTLNVKFYVPLFIYLFLYCFFCEGFVKQFYYMEMNLVLFKRERKNEKVSSFGLVKTLLSWNWQLIILLVPELVLKHPF